MLYDLNPKLQTDQRQPLPGQLLCVSCLNMEVILTGIVLLLYTSTPAISKQLSFHADLGGHRFPFAHTWEEGVGSGHAALGLRSDWQTQLLTVHKELGFKRVRFHGLLDDDMSVVLPDGSLSFTKIDTVYDYVMSIGMWPLVELSFMPRDLASGNQTYLHYKANVTPPHSYAEWAKLIVALAKHWFERYGKENISQWLVEVWNEPNYHSIIGGFWDGTQGDYFRLYNYTAVALKSVSDAFQVGGPVTSGGGWLKDFISFCQENKVPLDFVSTHGYPSTKESLVEAVKLAKSEVGGAYPLVFSEYNSGLYLFEDNHDTSFAAAFIAQTLPQIVADAEVLSYWTFSDIFEEVFFNTEPFHDGYGLLTVDGIPKPAFRAFQLLHRLSNLSIAVQWDKQNTSEVTAFVMVESTNSTVQVLLSNFEPPLHLPMDFNVSCQLTSIPATTSTARAIAYHISASEPNPKAVWEKMGRPQALTDEQRKKLMEASMVKPTQLPLTLNLTESYLTFEIYLAYRSMALVEVSFLDEDW